MKNKEYTLEQRLIAVAFFDGQKLHYKNDHYLGEPHLIDKFGRIRKTMALGYKNSWSDIMPVVEKINTHPADFGRYNELDKCWFEIENLSIMDVKRDLLFELVSDFCIEYCKENNIKI